MRQLKQRWKIGAAALMVMSSFTVMWSAGGTARANGLPRSDMPPTVGGWVQVSTPGQLEYIDQNQGSYLGSDIALMNNIDLSGYSSWLPFGGNSYNSNEVYTGTFDGHGHEITGLTIDDTWDAYVGFFGSVMGTIQNLGVDANVTSTVSNSVVGVIAGSLGDGSITNSFANGSVTGGYDCGGLVGMSYGSTISGTYSNADVKSPGGHNVGGLIGDEGDRSSISSSYATGPVSGGIIVGGFVGTYFGSITTSFFDTSTSGQSNGYGYDGGSGSPTAETDLQMQTDSPFSAAGWDLTSTWGIDSKVNGGYPYLQEFLSASMNTVATVSAGQTDSVTGTIEYGTSLVSTAGIPVILSAGNGTWQNASVTDTVYSNDSGSYSDVWTAPVVSTTTSIILSATVRGSVTRSASKSNV